MPRKTINQKINKLEEKIKELQEERKQLEEKKFKDVGKYLFDKWQINTDEEAYNLIDKFTEMLPNISSGDPNEPEAEQVH